MSNFLSNFKILNDLSSNILWFIYCFFYDSLNLKLSSLDKSRKNLKEHNQNIFYNYNYYFYRKNVKTLFSNNNLFLNLDIFWIFIKSLPYSNKKFKTNFYRSYFRILSTKNGFYFNFLNLKNQNNFNKMILQSFLSGLNSLWSSLRFWIFPLILSVGIIYISMVLKLLPFNKIMFSWIVIIMFIYWLMSGFVFFFKKYQFGKYTTSIQRFWRRSYILFWLIEGGTFLVFVFLTMNSSQESFYMFDQINIFKTHLYSWKFFFLKLFPLVILIILTYILMVSVKWNLYSKHSVWLLFLTFFLTYIVWLEFYQFFHIVNFYGNLNWVYDVDDHSWSLEQEPRRTRIVNHYVNLMFILKFWHIVFIYGFWLFFVIRCWETKRIRFPLLAANYQNFIILYIFAWVFMYPWFKFFFRKFLDTPYYWFYVNNRKIGLRILFNDFKLIYYGFINSFLNFNFLKKFEYNLFFYWKFSENGNNYEIFRKHILKEKILKSILQ